MQWIELNSEEKLSQAIAESEKSRYPAIAILKHSTRCPISTMAKNRLERAWSSEQIPIYYLDLLQNRDLSNQIASKFNVQHESPQLLLIKDGRCVLHQSHNAISGAMPDEFLANNQG